MSFPFWIVGPHSPSKCYDSWDGATMKADQMALTATSRTREVLLRSWVSPHPGRVDGQERFGSAIDRVGRRRRSFVTGIMPDVSPRPFLRVSQWWRDERKAGQSVQSLKSPKAHPHPRRSRGLDGWSTCDGWAPGSIYSPSTWRAGRSGAIRAIFNNLRTQRV